jgi:hypothetical protein
MLILFMMGLLLVIVPQLQTLQANPWSVAAQLDQARRLSTLSPCMSPSADMMGL